MPTTTLKTLREGDLYRFTGHLYRVAKLFPGGLSSECGEPGWCVKHGWGGPAETLATSPDWGAGHPVLGPRGRHPIGAREVELIERAS